MIKQARTKRTSLDVVAVTGSNREVPRSTVVQCWLPWRRSDVSWVHDISWRIWSRSWQDQPCCVIPENVPGCYPVSYLHVQVFRWLHELPQILSINSFWAQNQSEAFYDWTQNHDWQHYWSWALYHLQLCKVLTYSRKHPTFHCFYVFSFLSSLGLTLHKTTLDTSLDVTLPSPVYILHFMYILT